MRTRVSAVPPPLPLLCLCEAVCGSHPLMGGLWVTLRLERICGHAHGVEPSRSCGVTLTGLRPRGFDCVVTLIGLGPRGFGGAEPLLNCSVANADSYVRAAPGGVWQAPPPPLILYMAFALGEFCLSAFCLHALSATAPRANLALIFFLYLS